MACAAAAIVAVPIPARLLAVPRRIRVLTVDSQPLVQEGLAAMINREDDMTVVATASTGAEALDDVRRYRPDVVTLDLLLPDMRGETLVRQILAEFPQTRIVAITSARSHVHARRALDAGIHGYLSKAAPVSELVHAIRQVRAGERMIPGPVPVQACRQPVGGGAMETVEQVKRNVADLHWLATLLTGCRETATEVTFQALNPADDADPFFSTWMHSWSRRNVIARALAAVREDLARSARWMGARPVESREFPPQSWTLEQVTTKSDLERALLPIDVFPRAAVLLLAFERVPLKDAAVLLDSEPDLVRQALAAGARELTINLARIQGWKSPVSRSNSKSEEQHVRSAEIPS